MIELWNKYKKTGLVHYVVSTFIAITFYCVFSLTFRLIFMQKALVYFWAIASYCLLPHVEAQSYQSPGRKKIDSLQQVIAITENDTIRIRTLNALAQQYIDEGLGDHADSVARIALDVAESTNCKTFKADSYNKIAITHLDKNQINQAREYFFKALVADKLTSNEEGYVKRMGNIGITYTIQRRHNLAMQYYRSALSLAQSLKNKQLVATCYMQIGGLLLEQEKYPEALNYFYKVIKMGNALADKNAIYNSYKNIARIHEIRGEGIKALENAFQALKLGEDIGNRYKIELCLGNIGDIYKNQGNYSRALDYYFRALKIAEEIKNDGQIATMFSAIGGTYFDSGDRNQALDYFMKGYTLMEKVGNKEALADHLGNIGLVYAQGNNEFKALYYYKRAIRLLKDLGIKNELNRWLDNAAISYSTLAKDPENFDSSSFYYSRAMDYLVESLEIAKDLDKKNEIGKCNYLIGVMHIHDGNLNEAETELKNSIEMSQRTGELSNRENAYKNLAELYHKQGKLKLELENYKNYILFRDSIFNKENTERKLRSAINFEFEKKQSIERSRQERDNIVAMAMKKRQKTILWFVISFALLILLAAVFLYRSFLQKRRINSELEIKNQRIEWAHKIIAEKNHEITDSINYALHIQQAILPGQQEISRLLPNNFILYKPKDIISGDFYFFAKEKDRIFIAAADCTGHGVPGGLMSILASEKLRNAVTQSTDPGKILSLVNEGIKSTLHQSDHDYTNRNGMDIALCAIDLKNFQLEFAGANRPIWVWRKNSGILEEVNGTKSSIGGLTKSDKCFDTYSIKLQKGDLFYLFSDGYADQFGASDKKLTTKRFRNLLIELKDWPLPEQGRLLEEFINSWKGNTVQTDDMLVIGISLEQPI